MEESQVEVREEEEKEDGELEEGELEDEDEGEKEEGSPKPPGTPPDAKEEEEKKSPESKVEGSEGQVQSAGREVEPDSKEEEGVKKEKKDSKRKHREDDDEKEKRKKKKRKRKHASSDEEEEELPGGPPKFPHRKVVPHPHAFDDDMGFDAMLQQEMYLRGRSPPPGMVAYGPPGPYGHPMFRGGRPMSDYDSFDSGSDSEMRMDHRRRRRHRRSRSRSPSRKNEAICMYYMQGSCQRGKACPYSHDIQPQRKMELCKFYMMDCCAKREKCLYMHKDFPCKYYHTGVKCKSAEKCKFSHEPMSDATRSILLKHIELAPKDILGDFPRLTKEAANMVVSITEAHRSGSPMDVENMPGIMELGDRGFKYVDKAIRSFLKRQAKAKSLDEEDGGDNFEKNKHEGKMGESRRHGDMNEDKMSKIYGKHEHISPSKHRDDSSRVSLDRNVESLVKAFRNQSYDKGARNQPPHASPDDWRQRSGSHEGGGWMGNKSDERGPNTSQYKNMPNGDVPSLRDSPTTPNTSSCSDSITSPNTNMSTGGDQVPGNAIQNPSPAKKLGGMMACMPQKQRDFFQRIQQQHSVPDDDEVIDNNPEDTSGAPGTSNMNWYSSDEEGDGNSPSKPSWQNPSHNTIMSPNRTPPGSRTPPMGGGRFTPPGRKSDGGTTPPQTQPKNPFPNINLDDIKITDLAIVLNAVKNQAAAKNNSEDSNRDPRAPSRRDPRELSRDVRDTTHDVSRDNGDNSRYQQDRDSNQRSDNMYPTNSWGRNSWDSQSSLDRPNDSRDVQSGFVSPKRHESDQDQRQRMSDTDLRVLPRAEGRRDDINVKNLRCDTDMRMSSESSIYDVDLRQLSALKGLGDTDEATSPLPFKVPIHTPAKEIVASISSHPHMYYHLIKVTIPKPDFSHLKINKDDPRLLDDPRLRRMLRRNSTEDSAGKSPRAPSRYEMDGPFSPTSQGSRNEQRFNEPDSRDPRVTSSRDPRSEPRVDPRAEARPEPRVDPRTNVRVDPRVGSRGDPRTESRDPRADQMNDMRNQDPRMSGMYPGGGNMGMMEGGMQYQNMGPGPGSGPGPMGGPPLTRVDPRGRPGLLGPAPVPFSGNVPPPPANVGPGMPPYMMGQMGPNSGYYPDDQGDMMGGGKYPPGGSNWGGPMQSNDPRFHRDMGDGPHSYTPPPVS